MVELGVSLKVLVINSDVCMWDPHHQQAIFQHQGGGHAGILQLNSILTLSI